MTETSGKFLPAVTPVGVLIARGVVIAEKMQEIEAQIAAKEKIIAEVHREIAHHKQELVDFAALKNAFIDAVKAIEDNQQ